MSNREIFGHLHDLYGVDVSPDLISAVTDAVLVGRYLAGQAAGDGLSDRSPGKRFTGSFPLTGSLFDASRVKILDECFVWNKAVHIAFGIHADGTKEILGLWLEQNEGAKFWLRLMNEMKHRSVEDVLLAIVDGLKGFPEAMTAVFPDATVQTCIVHLLRHSLAFTSYKDRKSVESALKEIYRATGRDRSRKGVDGA